MFTGGLPGGSSIIDNNDGKGINIGNGNLIMSGLPTSDPHVVGKLWKNSNVLTVSAG